ncbi:MAG: diguanylate cyclase [Deltaproteobacteria bacterium]|nr:diguanylate cyclase [Deltaproteobacteria bacterium]
MNEENDDRMEREQILRELESLRKRRAEWETLENQCMVNEETLVLKAEELNERIKELNCMYAISDLVEKEIHVDTMLQRIVEVVPGALRYPGEAGARIRLNCKRYTTKNFSDYTCSGGRPIVVEGRKVGDISVCSRRDQADGQGILAKEKEDLIKAIAERLGRIIERKQAEKALRESEAKYATLVEKARDGIIIVQDYVFKFVNNAMADITGYGREELLGRNFLDVFAPEYRDLLNQRYERRISGEELPHVYEVKVLRKDNSQKHVEVSFGIVNYLDGKPADMAFIRDVSERIEAEEEIRRLAYHDALTGLPNRVLFAEQFVLAQARAQRHREKLAVILLDLDHFKEVNDTLGHTVGDELLKIVADRLRRLVRKEDVVARMGGDEFLVLLQEINDKDDATVIARKIVESLRVTYVIHHHSIDITTSVGIALFPDNGEDMDLLMRKADIAMYRAKEKGRDGFMLFSDGMS